VREFVAVNDSLSLFDSQLSPSIQLLKRESLIFSRIAIANLKESLLSSDRKSEESTEFVRELDWLLERGIIFEPEFNYEERIKSVEFESSMDSGIQHALELVSLLVGFDVTEAMQNIEDEKVRLAINEKLDKFKQMTVDELKEKAEGKSFFNNVEMMTASFLRAYAVQLRELNDMDAYPVLPISIPSIKEERADKGAIIQIALTALPIPDESMPWEQIMEYRSDPDSQSKFLALRNWMSEVARAELTPAEVEEKLMYLTDQYRRHMKLHRMKTNVGTLETIITTGAEVIGDLVSFKWGKAAEALFSLKKREVVLLEGELTAPGNEVAYIVKARETFS
jgi:hypothetical protein